MTVNITVTPESRPGATSNELSGNSTRTSCSLEHQIYVPLLAALTAMIILLLVITGLCVKFGKHQSTQLNKKVNNISQTRLAWITSSVNNSVNNNESRPRTA